MLRNVMLCVFMMAPAGLMAMGRAPEPPMVREGGKIIAPDFTLDTTSGITKTFSQERKGKKAVMFFWATWCPHCHDELVHINSQIENMRSKGFEIILVDMGETKDHVKAYLKYNNIALESFVDTDNSLQEAYQLVGVPTLYFVDEHGNIRSVKHTLPADFENLFGSYL